MAQDQRPIKKFISKEKGNGAQENAASQPKKEIPKQEESHLPTKMANESTPIAKKPLAPQNLPKKEPDRKVDSPTKSTANIQADSKNKVPADATAGSEKKPSVPSRGDLLKKKLKKTSAAEPPKRKATPQKQEAKKEAEKKQKEAEKKQKEAEKKQKQTEKKQKLSAVFQKIKTIAAGKPKGEKKEVKGRIYRSLRERSIIPIIIGCGITAIIAAFFFWYSTGANERLIDELKIYDVPDKVGNLTAKGYNLGRFVDIGPSLVPSLIKLYPKMTHPQKVGSVILLGEFKKQESMPILADAMLSGNDILAGFACRSLAKFQDSAVGFLTDKLKATPNEKKKYFIEALGLCGQSEALPELLNLCKDQDAQIRKQAVESLFYFSEKISIELSESKQSVDQLLQVIRQVLQAVMDNDDSVGKKAVEIFFNLQKAQKITRYANTLSIEIQKLFGKTKEAEKRARLITVMGVVGLCLKESGENYIESFKKHVRSAFQSDDLSEKVAAIYTLGRFQDEEMMPEFMKLLDSDSPEIARSVAFALSSLNNQQVLHLLLEKNIAPKPHILEATSQIFADYHMYARKLGMENQVMAKLMEFMRYTAGETLKKIAVSLSLYSRQPIDVLIFSPQDFKNANGFITKLRESKDPIAQYIKTKIPSETQQLLEKYDSSQPLPQDLLVGLTNSLNYILPENSLYQKERFASVKIADGIKNCMGITGDENMLKIKENDPSVIHFNRLLLEAAYPEEVYKTPLFNMSDFQDIPSLILKMRSPMAKKQDTKPAEKPGTDKEEMPSIVEDKRDPLSKHLWHQLSPEIQQLFNQFDPSGTPGEELKKLLLEESNQILIKPGIFEERLFKNVKLKKEIIELLNKKLEGRAVIYFNRFLLEQSYTKEILQTVSEADLKKWIPGK